MNLEPELTVVFLCYKLSYQRRQMKWSYELGSVTSNPAPRRPPEVLAEGAGDPELAGLHRHGVPGCPAGRGSRVRAAPRILKDQFGFGHDTGIT